jgi:hypothetical protein
MHWAPGEYRATPSVPTIKIKQKYMGRIILGIVVAGIGFLISWKTEEIVSFTGYNAWAETKFITSGGTRMLYKLIGVGVIFIGMIILMNLHQAFLEGTVGRLLGGRF